MKVAQVFGGFAFLLTSTALLSFAEQPPPPDFRSDSNVVLINATVLDRHDHPIRGLTKSLFRIFENKTERAVTCFAEENVPGPSSQREWAWQSVPSCCRLQAGWWLAEFGLAARWERWPRWRERGPRYR